jgi:trigger factor
MKVKAEKIDNSQVVLEVEVDPEEEEQSLGEAYRRLVKKADIPGFRKGKAPRAMFERFIGRDVLLQEAMEVLVPRLLARAIEEQELEPIDQPEVEIIQTEPVVFKATIPLSPTVELGDYKEIRIPQEPVEVTDEDLNRVIERLREEHAPWAPVERPAQLGDLVTMDVEGKIGDEPLDKREGIQYQVFADFAFPVPGFAEKLVGLEKGKEAEFSISFPSDHERSELAGHECWFKVLISEIKEKNLPELDDEFAKSVSDEFDSYDAFRERIASNLRGVAEEQARRGYEEQVVDAVVERANVEFPPVLIERDIEGMIGEQERDLRANRMSLEDYLTRMKMSPEQLIEELRPVATKRVTRSLVLSKVMEEEAIEVGDEELDGEIETMAQAAGERGDEVRQFFKSPVGQQSLQRTLLTRNTVRRLVEMAAEEAGSVEPPQASEAAATELTQDAGEAESAEGSEKGGEEDA